MTDADTNPLANALADQLRRARHWAWEVHDNRVPGAAHDLAWALIGLTRDHDRDTYSPWLRVEALTSATLTRALDLARDIAMLIRQADELQPHLVRDGKVIVKEDQALTDEESDHG